MVDGQINTEKEASECNITLENIVILFRHADDIDLFEEMIMNRPATPVIAVILVLIVTACSGMPDSRFRELRLEHHAARLTAEEEALEIYALGLHMYTDLLAQIQHREVS